MTADTICFGACLALLAALLVRLVAAGHHRIEAGGEPQPQPHQEPQLYYLGYYTDEQQDPGIITGHTTLPPAEHGVAAGGYRGQKVERGNRFTRVEVISPHDAPAETWGCEWGVDDHGDAKAPPEPLFRL